VLIEAPLSFTNVDFLGKVSLQGAVFDRTATFKKVRFQTYSDFSGVVIRQILSFQECHFERQATFAMSVLPTRDAKFYLSGTSVEVPLDFSESTILGRLTLEGAPNTLQVGATVYLNGINDASIVPQGELHIRNAEFHNSVYLDRSHWAKVDFAESDRTGFHRPIKLLSFFDYRQTVSNITNFAGAEFEGYGDLTGAQFRELVNVERTKFRKPFQLRWKQIEGKLGNHDGQLLKKGGLSEEDVQSYDELERNFNQLGDLESANECHYQKRLFLNGRHVEWAVLGYGVRPLNPFLCILIALGVFCMLNAVLFRAFLGATLFSLSSPFRERSCGALIVALSAARWKLSLPAKYASRTPVAWRVFLVEFYAMKILWVALAITLMNTSPVLKEFVPYFFPK
jgi:hypothetical protein